jgi:hypothetical protein
MEGPTVDFEGRLPLTALHLDDRLGTDLGCDLVADTTQADEQ